MKPIYKSKIIWIASVPMAIEIINLIVTQPFMSQKYTGILTLISGILTIWARFESKGEKIGVNTTTENPEIEADVEPHTENDH